MRPQFVNLPEGKACLLCSHADQWPPKHYYLGLSLEEAYRTKKITDQERSIGAVWEQRCGKPLVDAACARCDLHKKVGCDHLGLYTLSASGVKARFAGMTVEFWRAGVS